MRRTIPHRSNFCDSRASRCKARGACNNRDSLSDWCGIAFHVETRPVTNRRDYSANDITCRVQLFMSSTCFQHNPKVVFVALSNTVHCIGIGGSIAKSTFNRNPLAQNVKIAIENSFSSWNTGCSTGRIWQDSSSKKRRLCYECRSVSTAFDGRSM